MKLKDVPDNFKALIEIYKTKPILDERKDNLLKATNDKDIELEKALVYDTMRAWTKEVMSMFDISINIHGEENLPTDGSHVYIGNHQSYFDILSFLSIVKEPTTVIAKKEFESVPGLGVWIKRVRGVLINRGNKRASLLAINEGISRLEQGYSMVIFPEGTRSRSNKIGEFHTGAFKLATKKGYPIIPITFKNAAKVYEETGTITKGVTIDIYVHEMIETKDLSRKELLKIPEQVIEIIKSDLN